MIQSPQHSLPPVTRDQAFQAGKECGLNRANAHATALKYFNTPELRSAFDRGFAVGIELTAAEPIAA